MALKKETSLILIDPKISARARNFGDLSQSFISFIKTYPFYLWIIVYKYSLLPIQSFYFN